MKLHFGATAAQKDGLLIDFEDMKKEYQRYENWQPMSRMIKDMSQEGSNEYVESVTKSLLEKSKQQRSGKFDFQ